MKRYVAVFIIALLVPIYMLPDIHARRINTKSVTGSSNRRQTTQPQGGTYEIPADKLPDYNGCDTCGIYISGFDKPTFSDYESFFVVNHSDYHLARITGTLTYYSANGEMYTSRRIEKNIDVPPGETRHISIRSWDTQHSFRYLYSTPGTKRVNTFTVKFSPDSYRVYYNDAAEAEKNSINE